MYKMYKKIYIQFTANSRFTLLAVKHHQFVFPFTQILIAGADFRLIDTYFCVAPCILLCYEYALKTLLPYRP